MGKTKQTAALFIFLLLLMVIVVMAISSNTSYKSLESVRADDDLIEHYEGGMIIHTENAYGRYYDFIVNNGKTHVVEIRSKIKWGKEVYSPGLTMVGDFAGNILANVSYYAENGMLNYLGTLPHELKLYPSKKQAFWCFMDNREVILEEGVTAYPFEYEGQNYVLYVKVEDVK